MFNHTNVWPVKFRRFLSGLENDISSISVLKIEAGMAARGYCIGRDRYPRRPQK